MPPILPFRLCLGLAAVVAAACSRPTFTEPLKLFDGREISADVLNRGKESYERHCIACHGVNGDASGVAAPGLVPPPRNFRGVLEPGTEPTDDNRMLVSFKFGSVPDGRLPTDDDLERIVKDGLHGSAMLAWEIPDERLEPILHYIKTFSPRWKDDDVAPPVDITPDPFGPARTAEAIAKGEELYHTKAQCWQCHPAYAAKDDLAKYKVQRPDVYWSAGDKYSEVYGSEKYGKVKIVPPDFTWHPLRSVRPNAPAEPDRRKKDLYRAIAVGIAGTAMPTWKGQLPEDELWALVHYVEALVERYQVDPRVDTTRAAREAKMASRERFWSGRRTGG